MSNENLILISLSTLVIGFSLINMVIYFLIKIKALNLKVDIYCQSLDMQNWVFSSSWWKWQQIYEKRKLRSKYLQALVKQYPIQLNQPLVWNDPKYHLANLKALQTKYLQTGLQPISAIIIYKQGVNYGIKVSKDLTKVLEDFVREDRFCQMQHLLIIDFAKPKQQQTNWQIWSDYLNQMQREQLWIQND